MFNKNSCNLLETVKHNKYIRSQITGCPLFNSTGRHVSVYLDHNQVLRAIAYSNIAICSSS